MDTLPPKKEIMRTAWGDREEKARVCLSIYTANYQRQVSSAIIEKPWEQKISKISSICQKGLSISGCSGQGQGGGELSFWWEVHLDRWVGILL